MVTRGILHTGPSRDGLYSLPVTKLLSLAFFVASLGVWHARLAHAFYPTVRRALPTAVLASSKSSSLYTTCVVSKSHIVLFSESTFKASTPPDLICSDVWGPVSVVSNDGYLYYVFFFFYHLVNILGSTFFVSSLKFFLYLSNFVLLLKNTLGYLLNLFKLTGEASFKP